MCNCSTGEGNIKDETKLQSLTAEGTQKAVPQQSVNIETKLFELLPEKANEWEFIAKAGCSETTY